MGSTESKLIESFNNAAQDDTEVRGHLRNLLDEDPVSFQLLLLLQSLVTITTKYDHHHHCHPHLLFQYVISRYQY